MIFITPRFNASRLGANDKLVDMGSQKTNDARLLFIPITIHHFIIIIISNIILLSLLPLPKKPLC